MKAVGHTTQPSFVEGKDPFPDAELETHSLFSKG